MAVVSAMEIRSVDHGSSLRWTESASECHLTTTILRVLDSDGAEGFVGYDSYTPAPSDRSVLEALRSLSPALIGREATAREALARDLRVAVVFPFSTAPLSMMDVALWDLAARRAGLPLCRLLSSDARTDIPAYASLTTMDTAEDYLAVVARAREDGLTAVKVHAWGEPERDIALLERLRAEHPDLTFMHDAEGVYDRRGALRVARALESLSFRWFEAPLPDFDLEGYRDLKRRVDIPVLPAGYAMWDPMQIADALRDPPWSAVRSEASCTLGITALCQAAHLHVMLAFDNVSYFELPYPVEPWEYGVLDPIRPAADGTVAAPDGPGLGVDLDWYWIDGHAFAKASLAR